MVYLPLCYAAPVAYYYYLVNFPCEIEIFANYKGQTLANRCYIASSQGVQSLIVPVEKAKEKCLIKDAKISQHSDWQTLHWRTIKTAYSSAPFFDFYADEIIKLYQKKYVFLLDFNLDLQITIKNLLNYEKINFLLSNNYKKVINKNDLDMREIFLNKKICVNLPFNLKAEYYQVFADKFGFFENLSIFDLIFNLGNESRIYLKL
jgi:hypothetical protein